MLFLLVSFASLPAIIIFIIITTVLVFIVIIVIIIIIIITITIIIIIIIIIIIRYLLLGWLLPFISPSLIPLLTHAPEGSTPRVDIATTTKVSLLSAPCCLLFF